MFADAMVTKYGTVVPRIATVRVTGSGTAR